MSISGVPTKFPEFIDGIEDKQMKAHWKGHYIQEYQKEYDGINPSMDIIKSIMVSVAIAAGLIVGSAILAQILFVPIAISVTAIIAINVLGIGAGVCGSTYYGVKAANAFEDLDNLPKVFPILYEIRYTQYQPANNSTLKEIVIV